MNVPTNIDYTKVKGKKTGVLSEGLKKVHTAFENGTELVEVTRLENVMMRSQEFDPITEEIVTRKWRLKKIGTQDSKPKNSLMIVQNLVIGSMKQENQGSFSTQVRIYLEKM